MNKTTFFNTLILAVAVICLMLSFQQQTVAQSESYLRIFPFSTAAGQVGFFNQQDGKIYIYDTDLETCLFVSKVEQLGSPLVKIKSKKKVSQE